MNLVVIAEGYVQGGAVHLANIIKERLPEIDARVAILGHIQRGGPPSCIDRVMASRMGYHAVECLIEGRFNVFVGVLNNKMNYVPLERVGKKKGTINEEWMKIVKILGQLKIVIDAGLFEKVPVVLFVKAIVDKLKYNNYNYKQFKTEFLLNIPQRNGGYMNNNNN